MCFWLLFIEIKFVINILNMCETTKGRNKRKLCICAYFMYVNVIGMC